MSMTISASQPSNPNFLADHNFRFSLHRAPNVMFFGKSTELPSLELALAKQASPFVDVHLAGTKITYSDWEYTFIVDENMDNYMEFYNWMNDLGFPDDFTGYPRLQSTHGLYSDATLTILTSAKNPNIECKFINMFPYKLSGLKFGNDAKDVKYITCTATIRYQRFYIERISKP
jgi:hypothetical protein